MSINLYKKKTINNQPVLEELLSKSADTVDNKPLVYDSTTDNVKSADDLTVNTVTANCFHGPLDGTAKNATCFNNKTYAEACADILNGCAADSNKFNGKTYSEACADILSGCAADSNKLNGKTYSEVCADILSGTAANATCFAGKTCTEWKEIIKTTCVDNAALATNATCFNGCTYAQACTDIRDGLATQTCVDAVQNCADFIQSCVTAIESKIPAQASASNQLADKDFVNSSITTNTANFRGTYACVAELPSTGNTNNDYAFVCSLNTTTGNYIYDRYKWVASDSCWVCEYELNTTGFTAEQLASINSGITSNLVAKITDVYDNTVTVCMNGECKGSFNLNQNTDVCIDLGDTIRNACCADYATNAAQASEATNATCFNGCTYACAKEDFRNGMAAAISIGDSCPYQADGNRVVHIPAYPPDLSSCDGLDCTGTVTQVKVGTTAYDPVSGVVSLPEYPVIPTTVCTAECANTVKRNTANSGSCYLALFDGNTAVNDAGLYVSNSKAITYTPATGCLSTCYVRGISGLIAGNPIGCTSSVLGQAGTLVSSGSLNLYTCSPSIGFHVNRSAVASHCITALCGNLTVTVTNGTGCTDSTETAQFKFYSGGTLIARYLDGTAWKAVKVARCPTAITNAYYLPLFDANTASDGEFLYVSCCCPITYCPATGALTTCYIKANCFDGTATKADKIKVERDTDTQGFIRPILFSNNPAGAGDHTGYCCVLEDACCIWYSTTDHTLTVKNLCVCGNLCGCACGAKYADNTICFNGCTYSCAKADIRSGLISDIGVKVYCGTTCKCTLCKASNLYLSANAFNANATISTTTYPGACCTGTSNYVVTTMVCCAKAICRNQVSTAGNYHLALFDDDTSCSCANVYVSSACPIYYNPSTGGLKTHTISDCLGTLQTSKTQVTATNIGLTAGECYPLQTVIDCLLHCYGSKPAVYSFAFANASNPYICEGSMYAYNYRIEKLDSNDPVNVTWQKTQWKVEACTGKSWTVSAYVGATADSIIWKTVENIPTASHIITSSCNAEYPLVFSTCCATPANGDYTLYNDSANNLMYNPSTNTLTACCIRGNSRVIAGNPLGCTSTQTGCNGAEIGCSIELYHTTPFIDFHVNNTCADYSHRIIGCTGALTLIATNATGCTPSSQTANFSFCYTGEFAAPTVRTGVLRSGWPSANQTCNLLMTARCCNATAPTNYSMCLCGSDGKLYNPQGFVGSYLCASDEAVIQDLRVDSEVHLGAECDICIYDGCSNPFLCGFGRSLAIGYNSNDFVACDCYRIIIGSNNHMSATNDCGDSVVVGYCNCVCWDWDSSQSYIYGYCNKTINGGLVVGGWNYACGECSIILGWDSEARRCSIAIGESAYVDAVESIAIGCDVSTYSMGAIAIGRNVRACNPESIAIGTCAISELDNGLAIGYNTQSNYICKYNTLLGYIHSDIRRGCYRDLSISINSSSNIEQCELYRIIAERIDLSKDLATQCICTMPDINCSLLVRGRYNNLGITSIEHLKYSDLCNLILNLSDNSFASISSVGSNAITEPIYLEITGLSL